MRLPSRSRWTSLPSLTARRPNVVSAMSDRRQNSEIWLRISSFFIGDGGWETLVGRCGPPGRATTICPPLERRVPLLRGKTKGVDLPATSTAISASATLANILDELTSPGGAYARTILRDRLTARRVAQCRQSRLSGRESRGGFLQRL